MDDAKEREDFYRRVVGQALGRPRLTFAHGLTDKEFASIERRWSIVFPPDLALLLSFGLPQGDGFPDWRNGGDELESRLRHPVEIADFDIEQDQFWWPAWGDRPAKVADQITLARRHLSDAPTLIPVYAHRYIAAEPMEVDNPIFSAYQASDAIYYGYSLPGFLETEFGVPKPGWARTEPKHIRFWSDLVENDE